MTCPPHATRDVQTAGLLRVSMEMEIAGLDSHWKANSDAETDGKVEADNKAEA